MARFRTLVLSGFMATGKTTVGKLVAARLGVPFVDIDARIAEETAKPVGEVFRSEGEARFRDREARHILPLLASSEPCVLAFGGGAVTIPHVRHAALEAATVVTLKASAESIVARSGSAGERPNLDAASRLDRVRDLLALRRHVYAECHAAIDTEGRTPEEVASLVLERAHHDTIAVPLGERSYVVELVRSKPEALTTALRELAPSSLVTVTDDNVAAARGDCLRAALEPLGVRETRVVLAPGESHKTLASVARIWDAALEAELDRNAVVLAFGGGVVGDVAGFAASTLLRGVRAVALPTTLLSMVDASVGGKTGFDHASGKNLIGAFAQPARVVVDLEHLTTLPAREWAAGMAEVVKVAFACDAKLMRFLESHADALAEGDGDLLREVVRAAVTAKMRVVREDPNEAGRRALLNLGHTLGHALETHGGYTRWLHGEAVAIGTVLELEAGERLHLTPPGTSARAAALLARFGLPITVDEATLEGAWPLVRSDKKRTRSALKLPVVTGEGEGRIELVELDVLRGAVFGV